MDTMDTRLPVVHDPSETHDPQEAVRVDRCYIEHTCNMPRCSGRGTQFAIDMARGWTLAHYCDSHSVEEIQAQWRDLLDRPRPAPPGDRSGEMLAKLFRDLGTEVVDATPRPHLDQHRAPLPAPLTPKTLGMPDSHAGEEVE